MYVLASAANYLPSLMEVRTTLASIRGACIQTMCQPYSTASLHSKIKTIFKQSYQICGVCFLGNQVWKTAHWQPLSTKVTGCILALSCGFPLVLGACLSWEPLQKVPYLTPALTFTYQHLGKAVAVASVVACIALITLGSPVQGSLGLAVLGLHFFSTQRYIPSPARRLMQATVKFIQIAAGYCAFPLLLNKIYHVALLVLPAWQFLQQWREDFLLQRSTSTIITHQQLATQFSTAQPSLHPLHVKAILKQKTELDLDMDLSLTEGTAHIHPQLKDGLHLLFDKIVHQQLLEDEPWNYSPWQLRLKEIIVAIHKLPSKEEQQAAWEELAFIGYIHNSDKILHALNRHYLHLASQTAHTLEERVHVVLLQFRERLYQEAQEAAQNIIRAAHPDTQKAIKPSAITRHLDRFTSQLGPLPARRRFSMNKSYQLEWFLAGQQTQKITACAKQATQKYNLTSILSEIEQNRLQQPVLKDQLQERCLTWCQREGAIYNQDDPKQQRLLLFTVLTEMGILQLS